MKDAFDRFAPPQRGRFGDNESAQVPRARGPRVTGASDLIDLLLVKRAETDKALGVADSRDSKVIWLPRSQIEFEPQPGGLIRVTLPQWLAVDKGLL
jgi:hypothetical protein